MKSIAERYDLPVEGGVIHTEPAASHLIVELGLANQLKIPNDNSKASFQCVFDAHIADYYVAAMRFHGFEKEEDNGYAAFVMSKVFFTPADVLARVQALATQMEADFERIFHVPPPQQN